eukprot:SAG22_NODE_638_length_8262_cov_4.658826_4_plen_316_part_00
MDQCHTITIGDKSLGLVLDKTAATPTISKLAEGGACEIAAAAGGRIAAGMQVVRVGDAEVAGMGYAAVVEAIKSQTERPLTLTLREAPAQPRTPLRKLTKEEMAANSKKKTAEELRKLAEAMKNRDPVDSSSDSDDYSSDEEGSHSSKHRHRRERSGGTVSGPGRLESAQVGKLEKRVRYQQLDLANAKVEADGAKADEAKMAAKLAPVEQADAAVCSLRAVRVWSGDVAVAAALDAWRQEWRGKAEKATAAIEAISALPEVKKGLASALVQERRRLERAEARGEWQLKCARVWRTASTASLFVVAAAALYYTLL